MSCSGRFFDIHILIEKFFFSFIFKASFIRIMFNCKKSDINSSTMFQRKQKTSQKIHFFYKLNSFFTKFSSRKCLQIDFIVIQEAIYLKINLCSLEARSFSCWNYDTIKINVTPTLVSFIAENTYFSFDIKHVKKREKNTYMVWIALNKHSLTIYRKA